MKIEKFSFGKIKDILSRDEMKQIMAGSGGGGSCGRCANPHGGSTSCYAGTPGTGCACMCLWRGFGCGTCY
jgi:hypothetical protein